MAVGLAFFEGSLLVAAVCGTIVFWARPLLLDWLDLLGVLMQGIAMSACCITAFYYNDVYDLRIVRSFGDFAFRLVPALGVAFILLAGFYTVFPETKIAGGPFVSSLLLLVGLLLPLRAVGYAVMRSRPFVERVLLLGTSPLAARIIGEIDAQPHFRYAVVGVVDDGTGPVELPGRHPLLGPFDRLDKILDEIIEELAPHRIVLAMADRRGRLPVRSLLQARVRGILIEDGVEVYERLAGKLALESLRPSNLIFSTDFRKSRLDVGVGRLVSLLLSIVGLIVSAPLLGLIAAAIKLDSAGPVFFVQPRVGLAGRQFRLIKFRTMHPVERVPSEWVQDNESRITRVGKWLRKFRLDELPQFINILRGDMNVVGPRPHPVSNVELFTEEIPYYWLRAVVRPGVTGWAQVRYGYANNLPEEIEKMRYDLFYIKHLSLWFDLHILFDTVKIVLLGRGSRTADAYPPGVPAAGKGAMIRHDPAKAGISE